MFGTSRPTPGSLTQKLTEALAAAEGVPVTELDPLYHAIDVEALATLFAGQNGKDGDETVISFQFDPWRVFVRSDGRIRVCEWEQDSRPKPVFEGDTR